MNQLQLRLIRFTVDVSFKLDGLYGTSEYKNFAYQLDKSVSSVGANYSEAQSASSKKDFSNKVRIALKEARESEYWLSLFSERLPEKDFSSLVQEAEELVKILTTIVKKTSPESFKKD